MTWAPPVTTGLSLQVAGALAVVYATNPTIADVGLAANHTIFVDGTKSVFLTDEENPPGSVPGRMRHSFYSEQLDRGRYNFGEGNVEFVDYPGTVGILSILSDGPGAPTYDESEQEAVNKLKPRIIAAQGSDTLYVVGYSQGASAVVRAIKDLEQTEGYQPGNVVVILVANPRRNDGGLLTRLPDFTLPLVGATFGEGTQSGATRIIQVSKQYDGIADAPVYILNPVADANAILGFVYLHSGHFEDVDVDPENPPEGAIVTSYGNVTDILLPNQVGQLPLTQPLRSLGVPDDVIEALDPFLRAVIETGYDRPSDGEFAAAPVRFKLLPGPDQWAEDVRAVAIGAGETARKLGSLGAGESSSSTIDVATTAAPSGNESVDDQSGEGDTEDELTSTAGSLVDEQATSAVPGISETAKHAKPKATFGRHKPREALRSVTGSIHEAISSPKPRRAKPTAPAAESSQADEDDGNSPDTQAGSRSSNASDDADKTSASKAGASTASP